MCCRLFFFDSLRAHVPSVQAERTDISSMCMSKVVLFITESSQRSTTLLDEHEGVEGATVSRMRLLEC